MNTATIIRDQLGTRALMMLGASNILDCGAALQFKIGRNEKGITHIRIALAADDTYTVTFHRVRGVNSKVIAELDGVYVDSMHRVIEAETGLYTSL